MGDNKKCRKYKACDIYCLLCMEEKLAIATYNNPNMLLNQRLEILNGYKHKRAWLLEYWDSFFFFTDKISFGLPSFVFVCLVFVFMLIFYSFWWLFFQLNVIWLNTLYPDLS